MGLFGGVTDLIGGLVAGKPNIPAWQDISLSDQQTKAIAANQASLPALESMSANINQFNLGQLTTALNTIMPGFNQMVSGVTGNIQSELAGQIPADVATAVQNSAAARALTGGFGGSGLAGNLTARDLGLTSLDLTQRGISSAESWIGRMGSLISPTQFNMSSMFITPQQQFEDTFQNQEAQFQRQYVSNLNDWQHSLGYLGGASIKEFGQSIDSLISSYMGGMMGNPGSKGTPAGGDSGGGGGGGGGGFSGMGGIGGEGSSSLLGGFLA